MAALVTGNGVCRPQNVVLDNIDVEYASSRHPNAAKDGEIGPVKVDPSADVFIAQADGVDVGRVRVVGSGGVRPATVVREK